MNILTKIRFGVWAMHPMTAEAYLPIVAQLLKGDLSVLRNTEGSSATPKQTVEGVNYIFQDGSQTPYYNQFVQAAQSGVAIYDIEGAITKADQECGPDGTVTLMRQIRMLDKNPNIVGHILNIDSGGGEATNIAEVARFIRMEVTKPIIAHFNGLMCSAAYGIGCAADEVYATLNTDIVGSIGVLTTIVDWKPYFEAQGLKLHEIYADASVDKNDDYHEALKGNYEPLKKNLLNPFADQFINLVKTMRPATAQNAAFFTGKTFLAQDANGLIDGIRPFNESINRVFQLAKAQNANNSPQNSSSKNTTNMKIFGIDFGTVAKAENGDVTLTAEQYAKLEAASTTANVNAETIATMKADVDAIKADVAATSKTVILLKEWADAAPAANVAKPQGTPPAAKNEAIEKLNSTFAQMAGFQEA